MKTQSYISLNIALLFLLLTSCGIYTFSGSTLPLYIKTVSIPLFTNKTMEPGIAEEMTRKIRQAFILNNSIKVTEHKAHSVLLVTLTGYRNEPYTYDQSGNIREYRVTISASAVFKDKRKDNDIWKENNIVCYGVYSTLPQNRETEVQGKRRAMDDLSNILIENTISGW